MGRVLNYVVHQAIADNGEVIFTVTLTVENGWLNFEAYYDKVHKFETAGYVSPRYSPAYIQEMADFLVASGDWVLQ